MRLLKGLAGRAVDFFPRLLCHYVSNTYYNQASKEPDTEPEKPMITIATLTYLALLSDTPVESLSTPRGRALAMFEVARRRDGVKWHAKRGLVVLVGNDATGYRVTEGGAPIYAGTLDHTLCTVQRLLVGLDVPLKPTPTARAYKQFGFWADAQDGYLMSYVMFADGGLSGGR